MADPVLHLLVGPNGSGKSTLYETVVGPATHLRFVNADQLAAERWPDDAEAHGYEASQLAADVRGELLARSESFVTETVLSHPSKLSLVSDARAAGYIVNLHVVVVPLELTLARIADRVARGGHSVPEVKVRERYAKLWPLVASAVRQADRATAYDNSRAAVPFRVIAEFYNGAALAAPAWPTWVPAELRALA